MNIFGFIKSTSPCPISRVEAVAVPARRTPSNGTARLPAAARVTPVKPQRAAAPSQISQTAPGFYRLICHDNENYKIKWIASCLMRAILSNLRLSSILCILTGAAWRYRNAGSKSTRESETRTWYPLLQTKPNLY